MNILKKSFYVIIFCILPFISSQQVKSEIAFEITKGKVKKIKLFFKKNSLIDHELCKKVSHNFENLKNFDIEKISKNNANFEVEIKTEISSEENININITITNIADNSVYKKFNISVNGAIENCFEKCVDKIASLIYKTFFYEGGLFDQCIYFLNKVDHNLITICQYNLISNKVIPVSYPVSYVNSIFIYNNEIFLTKFFYKTYSFCVFKYSLKQKKFYEILSINQASAFCPFIFENNLYLSVSQLGTSGIYKLEPSQKTYFRSIKEFEAKNQIIKKMSGKIATSFLKYQNVTVYSGNFDNVKPCVYLNDKIIKQNAFDPALFEDKQLAMVHFDNNKFHIILIDLENMEEKILYSGYYAAKPSFSLCGNWIAFSAKEITGKEKIIIIHKSGNTIKELEIATSASCPIWGPKIYN